MDSSPTAGGVAQFLKWARDGSKARTADFPRSALSHDELKRSEMSSYRTGIFGKARKHDGYRHIFKP